MKKLKILFIGSPDSIHFRRWIAYFQKKGHEIFVVPIHPPKQKMSGVSYCSVEPQEIDGPVNFIKLALKMRGIVKKEKPDIVHAHYIWIAGWLGGLAGFHPLVLTAWGSDILIKPKQSILGKILTAFILKKADLITSESDELRSKIIELGGAKEKNRIVQWGVNTEQFKPGLDVVKLAKELKTENCFVVFSPRLFERNYNIDVIVKAIPAVLKKIPNAAFIFLNYPGECGAAITKLVEELGVQKAVRFIERIEYENMPLYYNLADVVTSIPSSDSASISLWEAMACGCPAIVSDIPANREFITDRENGHVVPLNDSGALAEAIINSTTDVKNLFFISSNRELVKKRGDHGENMKKMEDFYYGLVRNNK